MAKENIVELEYSRKEIDRNRPSEISIDLEAIENTERSSSLYRGENYYHLPAVKPSYYEWKIGVAFFSVGVGGISQILAAIIDFAGREEDRPLIRVGRYLALSGSLITSALYIIDLHTPDRWYNMMRIFRKTSWMSIGSWCLASFGALSGMTVLAQLVEDAGRKRLGKWMGRLFQLPAAAAGGMLCLYSGAELEATSLPVWERSHPLLPALFAAENASSAASAILLVTRNSKLPDGMRNRLESFSFLSGAVEEILYRMVSHRWVKHPGGGFNSGRKIATPVSAFQRMGTIASLFARILRMIRGRSSPESSILSPLLTLGSGLLLPVRVLLSGNESARYPEEYLSDTQPFALSERYIGARGTENNRNRIAKREHPMSPFVGLGLSLAGAAVIVFYSKKRGRDQHRPEKYRV